jgi:hypothetical protein
MLTDEHSKVAVTRPAGRFVHPAVVSVDVVELTTPVSGLALSATGTPRTRVFDSPTP